MHWIFGLYIQKSCAKYEPHRIYKLQRRKAIPTNFFISFQPNAKKDDFFNRVIILFRLFFFGVWCSAVFVVLLNFLFFFVYCLILALSWSTQFLKFKTVASFLFYSCQYYHHDNVLITHSIEQYAKVLSKIARPKAPLLPSAVKTKWYILRSTYYVVQHT